MNKTLKSLGILILVIIVLIGIFAFVNNKDQSSDQVITIGASLPLSGKSASFGERVKHGLDLAIIDVKQKENLDLRIVFEDDKGEAPTAVTVANKLIDTDKVKIIIGSIKSDAVLAMAPITEAHKVILFSPTAGADKISDAGDYVFRNIELATAHGKGATDFLVSKGLTDVVLFTAQASNAQTYGTVFEKAFNEAGKSVVLKTNYNPESTDFRTEITKALVLKPNAFYLAVATAKDAGLLTKQIRDQGFKGTIVLSIAAEAKEFFDTAGSAAEGVFVTSAAFDPNSTSAREFSAEFKSKYNVDPDWVSANSYDAVMLIAKGINSCGDQKTDCIRDFLYKTQNYPGVGGLTSFDKNGDVVKPVMIKVAKEGKFIKY